MTEQESEQFNGLIAGVYSFYRQEFSDFALGVWWAAMRPFDFAAVRDALNRHAVNPDNGQFCPKPADVIRLLGGSNLDRATMAWTKVQEAVHHVGTYQTVCFDDPIINAVIAEMGGWIAHGQIDVERELPFKQREFEQRYRAYRTRGGVGDYQKCLSGIFERENGPKGLSTEPVLIGDAARAALVYRKGGDGSSLTFTPLSAALPAIGNNEDHPE